VVLVQELPGTGCSCDGVVVQPAAAAKLALPVAGTRIIYEEVTVDCP
jgi:transposase